MHFNTCGRAGNTIGGQLPASMSVLTKLSRFRLANNYLTDAIPHQLFKLSSLTIFDVVPLSSQCLACSCEGL